MTIQAINEAMDIADDSSSRHRDSCYSSSSTEDWYVVLDGQPGCSRGDQRTDTLKTMRTAQINELEDQVESEHNVIEMPDQQHLDGVQECATVTDVPHYIDVCKLNVVVEDLNRSLEVRSSATTQLASIVKMNDYYPTSISPVAAEQRSILSISMDSIECKSKDTADRHSPTGIRFEQPPTVQERGQVSAALHQSSPPSASTSSISTGLSKLPRLFRSLLKKCSPTTTGSYRLVHNDHCVMATAEPILLQLSYVDGRRGLVDDNARKSLMQKSILANVKLDVHNNSSGLPKSRPKKVSYRKRVFQPFEAIWKGVDKSTVLGVTH